MNVEYLNLERRVQPRASVLRKLGIANLVSTAKFDIAAAHEALVRRQAVPERICWLLSRQYRESPGGHLRIYRGGDLRRQLGAAGLSVTGWHHAHGLHSPYWWLRCAVGLDREPRAVCLYHRLLVWDLMERPWITTVAERLTAPLIGKSLVVYTERPGEAGVPAVPAYGAAAA